MKQISSGLKALLAAGSEILVADLFKITLPNGQFLRANSGQLDLTIFEPENLLWWSTDLSLKLVIPSPGYGWGPGGGVSSVSSASYPDPNGRRTRRI